MEIDLNNKDWYKKIPPIPVEEIKSGSYILHFSQPVEYDKAKLYGDGRHYIGASIDVLRRINTHRLGLGSKMTKAAIDQGIDFTLIAIFPVTSGSRPFDLEKMLTALGASSYCPLCNEEEYIRIQEEKGVKKFGKRSWDDLPQKAKDNIIRANRTKKR